MPTPSHFWTCAKSMILFGNMAILITQVDGSEVTDYRGRSNIRQHSAIDGRLESYRIRPPIRPPNVGSRPVYPTARR